MQALKRCSSDQLRTHLEKLSMMAWRYARVPSRSRMIGHVSMKPLSGPVGSKTAFRLGRVDTSSLSIPSESTNGSGPGLIGRRDSSEALPQQGKRPYGKMFEGVVLHNVAHGGTLLEGVRRVGNERGQRGASSSSHFVAARCHCRRRPWRSPTICRAAFFAILGPARSIARRMRILAAAAGTRAMPARYWSLERGPRGVLRQR